MLLNKVIKQCYLFSLRSIKITDVFSSIYNSMSLPLNLCIEIWSQSENWFRHSGSNSGERTIWYSWGCGTAHRGALQGGSQVARVPAVTRPHKNKNSTYSVIVGCCLTSLVSACCLTSLVSDNNSAVHLSASAFRTYLTKRILYCLVEFARTFQRAQTSPTHERVERFGLQNHCFRPFDNGKM